MLPENRHRKLQNLFRHFSSTYTYTDSLAVSVTFAAVHFCHSAIFQLFSSIVHVQPLSFPEKQHLHQ